MDRYGYAAPHVQGINGYPIAHVGAPHMPVSVAGQREWAEGRQYGNQAALAGQDASFPPGHSPNWQSGWRYGYQEAMSGTRPTHSF